MAAAHTPGPWGLKINRDSHVNGVDLTFAVCARGFTLTSGQSMEHLLDVAPAPILAAECAGDSDGQHADPLHTLANLRDTARATIAKATGSAS